MVRVPVVDITEVNAGASGQEAIDSAVKSLRRDGVVILRQALEPNLLDSLTEMVTNWHERFLSGEVQNYSLGEETATVIPEIWEDTFTEPRELQGFRKWNIAGMDERILPLV